MIAAMLAEAALRSLALGGVVGLGLWISRARGVRLRMTAWTLALLAALLMPAMMQWRTLQITAPRQVVERAPAVLFQTLQRRGPALHVPAQPSRARLDWRAEATTAWSVVVTLLLLRLLIAFALALRVWRRAAPVRESWATGMSVRESPDIGAPATFGSGILLPLEWREWDGLRRRAVIAHERAHVRWGDFYVQLLGRLHLALFWFSPLAWWLQNRLTLLAEAAADDAALADVADRTGYAEILLDFARRPQRAFAAVAMARSATITRRVDRILTGAPLHATERAAYLFVCAAVTCVAALIAGSSVHAQAPASSPAKTDEAKGHCCYWRIGADHGDSYVIVSGDSIIMSGLASDVERARSYRSQTAGDYIWFTQNGKSYLVTDPATLRAIKEMFKPQEELQRKQDELERQQEPLERRQDELSKQQDGVKVLVPPMDQKLHELEREAEAVSKRLNDAHFEKLANDPNFKALVKSMEGARELNQDQLNDLMDRLGEMQDRLGDDYWNRMSDMQSRIGELQSELGELQSRAGEEQSRIGEQQSKLGEEQSRLGDQQSKLGEEQSRLAEQADREIRKMLQG